MLLAAASAAVLGIAGVLTLSWRILRYTVRAHDELMGDEKRPGVRILVERLDADLREHMRDENNTIGKLTANIEELFCLIRKP